MLRCVCVRVIERGRKRVGEIAALWNEKGNMLEKGLRKIANEIIILCCSTCYYSDCFHITENVCLLSF